MNRSPHLALAVVFLVVLAAGGSVAVAAPALDAVLQGYKP